MPRTQAAALAPAAFVIAVAAFIVGAFLLLFPSYAVAQTTPTQLGEPKVTRTYYTEPSGRQCSQTVVTRGGVAVAVSCSYPPAESRIADLLEGAGQ